MADARKSLEALLKILGESSQFVSSGSLPPVLPGLEVNGVGTVGLPISPEDVKRLIAKATQAPSLMTLNSALERNCFCRTTIRAARNVK